LLARPALRRALGEDQATPYEKGLLGALRARVDKDPKEVSRGAKEPLASPRFGVEAVLSSLFLALENTGGATLSPEATRAFDRLWSVQIREGSAKGSWAWFSLEQDPWEMPDSAFYGASLAALAVGTAPAGYRERPEIRERVNALTEYLQREQQTQPLHNRLTLLWASSKLPGALAKSMRRPIIEEVLRKQQDDGGWTIESLGPWKAHPQAPPATGSNSYATAFTAFVLQKAVVPRPDPAVTRALNWLRSRQDRQSGYWAADSMNRRYEPDSMPLRFMQDAATAYATLALLESR